MATYEEYIAGYHGAIPALSREKWTAAHQKLGLNPIVDSTNPKDLIGDTKLPLRFIPGALYAYVAQVMELGAAKYGPMNWRTKKVRATVYYEAALRHLISALEGEELDPESGQPHAAHVAACMGILLDAIATGNLIDDRFTPGVFGRLVSETISKKEKE